MMCDKSGKSRLPRRLVLGSGVLVVGLAAVGCLLPPSEQQMFEDLSLDRQRTYEVWKTNRNEHTLEARLDGPLSLDDAIKAALQFNKVLQETVEAKGVARGQVISAYQLALPSVTIGGGYNRYESIPNDSWSTLNQYTTGLTVTQPLGQGASIPAAMRSARLVQALADEQVRGTVQNIIYQTASAYYNVLLAQHLYDANNDAVISAKAHLRVVQERRIQGVDSEFEVLRTQVDVANFEAQKLIQKNAIDTALTQLLKIIGVSQESKITLSDILTFEPMKPVFERAVEVAFKNRSDLYMADLSVRQQKELLRIAQSDWWPAFAANFNQIWARPDPGSIDRGSNHWGSDRWVAGVQGTWSLSPWATAGNVIAQRSQLRQSEIKRRDAHETAIQELQQAINSVANAEQLVDSQRMNRTMAAEALRLANVGYEYGAKTELDVIQARSALTTAVSNYYSALHDHTQARLQLQIAMGILGTQPGITGQVPRKSPTRPGQIAEFAVSSRDFGEAAPAMVPSSGGDASSNPSYLDKPDAPAAPKAPTEENRPLKPETEPAAPPAKDATSGKATLSVVPPALPLTAVTVVPSVQPLPVPALRPSVSSPEAAPTAPPVVMGISAAPQTGESAVTVMPPIARAVPIAVLESSSAKPAMAVPAQTRPTVRVTSRVVSAPSVSGSVSGSGAVPAAVIVVPAKSRPADSDGETAASSDASGPRVTAKVTVRPY